MHSTNEINDEIIITYLRARIQKVMAKQYIHPEWDHYNRDLADCILFCEKLNETIEALGAAPEPIRIGYKPEDFKFDAPVNLSKEEFLNLPIVILNDNESCQCYYCSYIKNENQTSQAI